MTHRTFRAAAIVLALSSPAHAQPPACAPLPIVLDGLAKEYGEVPVNRGIDDRGVVAMLTLARDGSWSVVATDPRSGTACVVMTGRGWSAVPLPGKES